MSKSRERAAGEFVDMLDSAFLRALSEPARLEILKVLLVNGPLDIGTIASKVPQDRSVVSRHLKALEDAGIVQGDKDGRHRFYRLDPASFLRTLESMTAQAKALAGICCPPLKKDRDDG